MTEWLMVPLSKSGRQECLVGSNPTLSANRGVSPGVCLRSRADAGVTRHGEVLEWLNRHAWRACVVLATVGSNPTLSAKNKHQKYLETMQLSNLVGHTKSVGFVRADSQPNLRFGWVRVD